MLHISPRAARPRSRARDINGCHRCEIKDLRSVLAQFEPISRNVMPLIDLEEVSATCRAARRVASEFRRRAAQIGSAPYHSCGNAALVEIARGQTFGEKFVYEQRLNSRVGDTSYFRLTRHGDLVLEFWPDRACDVEVVLKVYDAEDLATPVSARTLNRVRYSPGDPAVRICATQPTAAHCGLSSFSLVNLHVAVKGIEGGDPPEKLTVGAFLFSMTSDVKQFIAFGISEPPNKILSRRPDALYRPEWVLPVVGHGGMLDT